MMYATPVYECICNTSIHINMDVCRYLFIYLLLISLCFYVIITVSMY